MSKSVLPASAKIVSSSPFVAQNVTPQADYEQKVATGSCPWCGTRLIKQLSAPGLALLISNSAWQFVGWPVTLFFWVIFSVIGIISGTIGMGLPRGGLTRHVTYSTCPNCKSRF